MYFFFVFSVILRPLSQNLEGENDVTSCIFYFLTNDLEVYGKTLLCYKTLKLFTKQNIEDSASNNITIQIITNC